MSTRPVDALQKPVGGQNGHAGPRPLGWSEGGCGHEHQNCRLGPLISSLAGTNALTRCRTSKSGRAIVLVVARVTSCYWNARAQKRTHRDFSCLVPVAIHTSQAHEDGAIGISFSSGETFVRPICARSHSVALARRAVCTSRRPRSITSRAQRRLESIRLRCQAILVLGLPPQQVSPCPSQIPGV